VSDAHVSDLPIFRLSFGGSTQTFCVITHAEAAQPY
jgi:hypothetical protein